MSRRKRAEQQMYTDGICIPEDPRQGPGWIFIIGSLFVLPPVSLILLFLRAKRSWRRTRLAVYRRYAAFIGDKPRVGIAELAAATGRRESHVLSDVREMIDRGYLGRDAFLDHRSNVLCLSLDARAEEKPPRKAEKAAAPKPEKSVREAPPRSAAKAEKAPDVADIERILTRIRTLNERIADAAVSEKIDRIGMQTASIFSVTQLRPEQSEDVRKVLGYYLPTTFKLLEMYAMMEAEPHKTEDIRQSMRRIESSLDLLITAFEKIREDIFRSEALDVDTDIDVLNAMLIKDGLFAPKGTDLREVGMM